ncbi:aldehyde dehydrogenase family protein [Actinomycetospora sp. NBRC 106378]|uniref:aldehyde dehydrogenase family protein n=1 Tax=Actinomycetospora sp. NBRC 106378 TaxID=3032208 RepID=UPI0024A5A1C2|nr:aldehyde dehydrogenase family protein [Actinomycetospora sp. NBRC 106378]GLZ50852.1 aldehyde dehydrogenase [Actinomycetospora sp. NBRC 106378]
MSVAHAPSSTPVAEAVAAARAAFDSGRTRSLAWRRGQLSALERLLTEAEDELVAALAADLGRPAVDAWLADLSSTAAESRYARRYLGWWARPRVTGVPVGVAPAVGLWRPEPVGVVAIVGPWNYPVYLTLAPLVAALAAGDTAVLKPSEYAPHTAEALARLVPRYLDPQAVTVVQGGPAETQELIAAGVDHVFFTGSPEVGAKVAEAAGRLLVPVTLELGGKSPTIVDASADVAVAARRVAWTKLMNSGQTCVAPDYVLVHREVADTFVAEFTAAAREMREGDLAMRVVDDRHGDRVRGLLTGHGGTVVLGGDTTVTTAGAGDLAGPGVDLTVVRDPDPDSPLMREEIFGPVLPVLTVDSVDEALAFVEARPRPLATYVFSRTRATIAAVRDRIATGGIVANHTMFHVLVPQLPFGGIGRSGSGAYHGRWGFEALSHRRPTLVKPTWPDPSLVYPPYAESTKKLLRKIF